MPRHPDHHLALIQKAQDGDLMALEEVKRQHKPNHPIWEQVGNLALQAEGAVLKSGFGNDVLAREAVERKLAKLRGELAGPSPSPLEKLLVERIVACWLQLYMIELSMPQQGPGLSIKQAKYQQDRLDRAHRRYLSAIKSLAQVRRLLVPVMQVNVAEQIQQVNVVGPVGS